MSKSGGIVVSLLDCIVVKQSTSQLLFCNVVTWELITLFWQIIQEMPNVSQYVTENVAKVHNQKDWERIKNSRSFKLSIA